MIRDPQLSCRSCIFWYTLFSACQPVHYELAILRDIHQRHMEYNRYCSSLLELARRVEMEAVIEAYRIGEERVNNEPIGR